MIIAGFFKASGYSQSIKLIYPDFSQLQRGYDFQGKSTLKCTVHAGSNDLNYFRAGIFRPAQNISEYRRLIGLKSIRQKK